METKQTLLKTPENLHRDIKIYAYDNKKSIHDAILELASKGLEKQLKKG